MATTRLMAMHIAKGKTAARSIREKIDYAINPAKTEKGELHTNSDTACGIHGVSAGDVLSQQGKDSRKQIILLRVHTTLCNDRHIGGIGIQRAVSQQSS